MILIDNSQIILSSIFSQQTEGTDDVMGLVRHITLNTYRYFKEKFSGDYGDIVICRDAGNYWRKDVLPYYKANRKKTQQKNQEHWDKVFESMRTICDEMADNMPYKNIRVDRCEADDVIAVITKHYCQTENVLIVSNDKDFQQLLVYPNVSLYSPMKKKMVVCADPQSYLLEQIIRGDSSDGIPNIISDEDTLVTEGKRQKPITAKKLAELTNQIDANSDDKLMNSFHRNEKLIDLNYIPEEYVDRILDEYKKPINNRNKMFNYFVEKKLTNLMQEITSF